MILTLLIPSRYRFDRLVKCIDSFVNTANDKSSVEFIIKFDTDDHESYSRIHEIRKDINIKFLVTDRLNGYQSLHEFANEMFKLAGGRWVMFSTDDLEMETQGWDSILSEQPIKAVCLCPHEGEKVSEVAPIVLRQACEAIGYFCMNHAQDRWFNDVYSEELVPIDIKVKHLFVDDQSNIDRRNAVPNDDWDKTENLRWKNKQLIKRLNDSIL